MFDRSPFLTLLLSDQMDHLSLDNVPTRADSFYPNLAVYHPLDQASRVISYVLAARRSLQHIARSFSMATLLPLSPSTT